MHAACVGSLAADRMAYVCSARMIVCRNVFISSLVSFFLSGGVVLNNVELSLFEEGYVNFVHNARNSPI